MKYTADAYMMSVTGRDGLHGGCWSEQTRHTNTITCTVHADMMGESINKLETSIE